MSQTGDEPLGYLLFRLAAALRPQVAAAIVASTRTATANRAALALAPESVRNSATLYPPPEILRRGEWFEPLPAAAQRLRDRLWTEIKSA